MKQQALYALAAVAMIAALFLFASIVGPTRADGSVAISTDTFLQNRTRLFTTLRKQLLAPVGGVTVVLPASDQGFKLFPGEDHIRHVLRRHDWIGRSQFQTLLNLDESALPPDKQGNSQTMTATLLLEHFFGDLRRLGYRHQGTPSVMLGDGIQMSSNIWFKEADSTISVSGTVFVSTASKKAIMLCRINERLPAQ